MLQTLKEAANSLRRQAAMEKVCQPHTHTYTSQHSDSHAHHLWMKARSTCCEHMLGVAVLSTRRHYRSTRAVINMKRSQAVGRRHMRGQAQHTQRRAMRQGELTRPGIGGLRASLMGCAGLAHLSHRRLFRILDTSAQGALPLSELTRVGRTRSTGAWADLQVP